MALNGKHAYRFSFLKSEHWDYIRKLILSERKARCSICKHVDWSNDVHHIRYRESWKRFIRSDFHVLCRDCHQLTHLVLDHRKRMGAQDNRRRYWRNIERSVIRIRKRIRKFGREQGLSMTVKLFQELESTMNHHESSSLSNNFCRIC